MIVIVSNKWDLTVDFVVLALERMGKAFVRLNTEDLPEAEATFFLPSLFAHVNTPQRRLSFDEVRAVWLRRPGYVFDQVARESRPSGAIQRFVDQQWRAWRDGLETIPHIQWVNSPWAEQRAENKIRQLYFAAACGFQVPDTAFTNSSQVVQKFLVKHDQNVIVKAVSSPLLEDEDGDRFVFTNPLEILKDEDEASLRIAPVIVQQRISPKLDYRVTVVGNKVFAVRVVSESGETELDWRTQKAGLRFERCTLPAPIEEICRNFVSELDLKFGAIDLLESGDEFFFLEINPNGEWGWLQKNAGIPIAEALADLLIGLDASNASRSR